MKLFLDLHLDLHEKHIAVQGRDSTSGRSYVATWVQSPGLAIPQQNSQACARARPAHHIRRLLYPSYRVQHKLTQKSELDCLEDFLEDRSVPGGGFESHHDTKPDR